MISSGFFVDFDPFLTTFFSDPKSCFLPIGFLWHQKAMDKKDHFLCVRIWTFKKVHCSKMQDWSPNCYLPATCVNCVSKNYFFYKFSDFNTTGIRITLARRHSTPSPVWTDIPLQSRTFLDPFCGYQSWRSIHQDFDLWAAVVEKVVPQYGNMYGLSCFKVKETKSDRF